MNYLPLALIDRPPKPRQFRQALPSALDAVGIGPRGLQGRLNEILT
jgi:hypothetical protein